MTDKEKLLRYAKRNATNRYWFTDPNYTHSKRDALAVIDACLVLQVDVTDVVTSNAWLRLINKVVELEQKVEGLSE